MEIWKPIRNYEGIYEVSNKGKVRRTETGYIQKQRLNVDGYVKATLTVNSIAKDFAMHRLVAEAFIPNNENKETVNHKDGNKTNNNVENLEWADRHEQMLHAYRLGLKKAKAGCRNYNAALTEEQVRFIREQYKPRSKEYGTVALGRMFGVNNATIGDVVRRVTYKDVT